MREYSNLLYLEWAELIASPYCVPPECLKSGIKRFRAGKSQQWRCIDDPCDRRKVLIEYGTIPIATRIKYSLPDEAQMLEQHRLREFRLTTARKAAAKAWNAESLEGQLQRAAERDYVAHFDTYAPACGNDRAGDYARAHAVFARLVELNAPGASPRYTHEQLHPHFRALRLKGFCTTSLAYFRRQLRTCVTEGITAMLLHGNRGNAYAEKANDFHKYIAEAYYSLPYKYAYNTVTEFVNFHAEAHGLKRISESWVKGYLNEPGIQNRLMELRHGKKEFVNRQQQYVPRTAAQYAGDLWLMDGSPLQFFCWNAAHNKQIRLTLFVLLDAHSRKIVGYDLSPQEDRYSALNSMNTALKSTGIAPYELVYDNFSGTKTDEFQDVQAGLQARGVVFRASKVGNPQDKSQVERWFGTFQTRFCKHLEGYFGEGIMTRRLDGKGNPEFKERVYELRGVPNMDTMKARVVELVQDYNATPLRTGELSPNARFAASEKPNARPVSDLQRALLFWPKREVTVRNSMVRLKVRKQEYVYLLSGPEAEATLNGKRLEVRYNPDELADPKHQVHLFWPGKHEPADTCHLATLVKQAQANQTQADCTELAQSGKRKKAQAAFLAQQRDEVAERGKAAVGDADRLYIQNPRTARKYERDGAEEAFMYEELGIDRDKVVPEPAPVAHLGNAYFSQDTATVSATQNTRRLRQKADFKIYRTDDPRPDDD